MSPRFPRLPALLRPWILAALVALPVTGTGAQPDGKTPGGAPPPAKPAVERELFDGETLAGWKPSAFDSQAAVRVENPFRDGTAAIILEKSAHLSGITWTKEADLPRMNYELSLEAMKLEGSDFFCGLTFPVGDSAVTFVVGGWGGMVTGISCIDNSDASDNETSTARDYKPNRWYRIRVRVTPGKLEAWVDDEQVVDFETTNRKLDLRFGEIKYSLPLGIAAYETKAALREIRLRRLP
ncbi:MAG: DUF1080 domain-containing protein [Verrucomicrobia bacterium]|nr:DUF1080 domain-containing protein [Verrucomicrobiota bacterium]